MAPPIFRRADFAAALHALLPTGRVWPREADTAQAKVLDGLAGVYERQSADAAGLLVEAFPATTSALLTEWESSLGLPDECTGPAETLDARRRRVVQKLTAGGGQSRAYFLGLAAALGYPDAAIREYRPFTVGSPCTDALTQGAWLHAWALVLYGDGEVRSFAATAGCTDALRSWGSAAVECVVRRAAPAHTAVTIAYDDPDWLDGGEPEDWGELVDGAVDGTDEDWGELA